ncbi:hypothetical protein [Prosthecobacter dejongeii]|uniref:Uncharacterized protein n=1 Tax=Prosthecobacter dejongeii TaxID=48465 RepID=A0A7W8DPC5_9BACT|nr:hypothetical protein [Prosthecobacter dejongeii]MBB5036786.1 hypothetical protein [Prosthecobacter dejongeii]
MTTNVNINNHESVPETQASSEPAAPTAPPFTPNDTEGIIGTPSQIKHLRAQISTKSAYISSVVQTHAGQIIEAAGGVKLLAAVSVFELLKKLGHPLPSSNAIALGDVLGHKGLKLPRIFCLGKRRYALHLTDSSDAEKIKFQNWLDNLNNDELKTLLFG